MENGKYFVAVLFSVGIQNVTKFVIHVVQNSFSFIVNR